ncbi:hypothetical protein [Desulfosporosinus sp. OT]|uniref:hypothetical protein n=1 Tax=Desulfosporosinus sp. OT TaxID=913865 RepID=UPI000223A524|nr:hypothetical protein [Desulfosporosinus sp. OT]EGW41983.1 hypothetical protein DOT_0043 [Desulfosporosinus sp. OT]
MLETAEGLPLRRFYVYSLVSNVTLNTPFPNALSTATSPSFLIGLISSFIGLSRQEHILVGNILFSASYGEGYLLANLP